CSFGSVQEQTRDANRYYRTASPTPTRLGRAHGFSYITRSNHKSRLQRALSECPQLYIRRSGFAQRSSRRKNTAIDTGDSPRPSPQATHSDVRTAVATCFVDQFAPDRRRLFIYDFQRGFNTGSGPCPTTDTVGSAAGSTSGIR